MTIGFAAMFGFAAKVLVLVRRIRRRCPRITLDRHSSAFAVGQNVSHALFVSPRSFAEVAPCATKFAPQFFGRLLRFMRPPRMIRRSTVF
jgi:hypothetical protein